MMTKTVRIVLCLALLIPLCPAATLAAPAADTSVDQTLETLVFVGEYQWSHRNQPGPLRAEFTATGANVWDVSFDFRFDGRDRTYRGTAAGSLSQGQLAGEVKNENERRTFTFAGEFDEQGRFAGTHEETTPSRAGRTGTMTLTPESAGDDAGS